MIEIGGRKIGPEHPPVFVADIGANHDGSLTRALMLTTSAAQSGVDFVKYQSFNAETIVSHRGFEELGQIAHQATWRKSAYDTYKDAALPMAWIPTLAERCRELGIGFMSTAYSLEIADAIDPYVDAHKIGSGDITWPSLICHVATKGKPVMLATGASTADEVEWAISYFLDGWPDLPEYGEHLVLMQCTTNYTGDPANARLVNLRVLDDWRRGYHTLLGLSDHTPGFIAACAAVAKGACVIEKHFTDDRGRVGPDHGFAMTPMEWRRMVDYAKMTWQTLGDGVKKVEDNEVEARIVQRRALRWRHAMAAGNIVGQSDVIPTRPCPEGALEPDRLDEVVGTRLTQNVAADTLVRLVDLGGFGETIGETCRRAVSDG